MELGREVLYGPPQEIFEIPNNKNAVNPENDVPHQLFSQHRGPTYEGEKTSKTSPGHSTH